MDATIKFESLDTTYVDLAALIRYLQERAFTGRLHLAWNHYQADVLFYGSGTPSVWESDHSNGSDGHGDAAMERLLLKAREPGGLISVYEQASEEATAHNGIEHGGEAGAKADADETESTAHDLDWDDLLGASGNLIGAVEHAIETTGHNFADNFRAVRIELGDDYLFLDPTIGGLEYSNSKVRISSRPSTATYVSGLTECLRRMVAKLSSSDSGGQFRQRVALELGIAARKQPDALGEFALELERIAGTRVL